MFQRSPNQSQNINDIPVPSPIEDIELQDEVLGAQRLQQSAVYIRQLKKRRFDDIAPTREDFDAAEEYRVGTIIASKIGDIKRAVSKMQNNRLGSQLSVLTQTVAAIKEQQQQFQTQMQNSMNQQQMQLQQLQEIVQEIKEDVIAIQHVAARAHNRTAIRDNDTLTYLRVAGAEALNPPQYFPSTQFDAQNLTGAHLNSLLAAYELTHHTQHMSVTDKKQFFKRFIGLE